MSEVITDRRAPITGQHSPKPGVKAWGVSLLALGLIAGGVIAGPRLLSPPAGAAAVPPLPSVVVSAPLGYSAEGLTRWGWQPYLRGMTNLELTEVQKEALIRELSQIIDGDRYSLSPRIVVLKDILGIMRPEPARPAPVPPRWHYELLSKGRYRRRG